jgi:hypothetical protein
MDPYLERHWGDVGTSLLVYLTDQLNEQLPPDLVARVEEEGSDEDLREEDSSEEDFGEDEEQWDLESETPTRRHVRILEPDSGDRLVTAIELLTPADKATESGRQDYRQKQRTYVQSGANLVEIDLIRSGPPILDVPERYRETCVHTPYLICVRRMAHPERLECWRFSLRDPLPDIRVPLRARLPHLPLPWRLGEADVLLRLRPLLDRCYRRGRYDRIDYRRPPNPPLSEDDARWADALLREKGLR